MREASLALLDIAQNAIDAGATLIEISVEILSDGLKFEVADNGDGMDGNMLQKAVQKGVSFKGSSGLGLAILKEEVESTGGKLCISSQKGVGTRVIAEYKGRALLGDLGATYVALVDDGFDVVLSISACECKTGYDSRELKSSSCTAALQSSGTLRLIREDINKNIRQNGGAML